LYATANSSQALRGNIFGGIPAWQLFQNLTVTLADHVSYLLV
jgi:hypothetical protein